MRSQTPAERKQIERIRRRRRPWRYEAERREALAFALHACWAELPAPVRSVLFAVAAGYLRAGAEDATIGDLTPEEVDEIRAALFEHLDRRRPCR